MLQQQKAAGKVAAAAVAAAAAGWWSSYHRASHRVSGGGPAQVCFFLSLFIFFSFTSPHLTSPYLVINGRGSILATATYTARMARSKNNKIVIKIFADIKMKMNFHFYE